MNTQTERAKDIFLDALDLAASADCRAFLDRACGADAALRAEVEGLLAHHPQVGSFLATAAPDPEGTATFGAADALGTCVGPYRLMEQIGEGGFGLVFVAEQTVPVKRRVALKLIKPGMDSREVVARFEAERQALALMDHPYIARVFDGGATPTGRPYFVMELVKGVPITRYCDDQRLPPRDRLGMFADLCGAVQHAHQKGVIHRDLKPSNVLVASHDGTPVVKVIDFGVAKAVGAALTDKTVYTRFAQMVGTPLYMSPEQAGSSGLDVDTRADIYSLGVLLYELLTGVTPFDGDRLRNLEYDEIRRIIREDEPAKPSTRLSTLAQAATTVAEARGTDPRRLTALIRGELDWVVMKALEKDRNRRYESAAAFAADVQRYLRDEPVQACPPSAAYRVRKFVRRNRGPVLAAGMVLVFLVLLGSGVGWAVRDRSAREAVAARQQGERRARVAGQVESLLAEADRLELEQNWPEALVAARRAEAAVDGGEADPATAERVRQKLKELAFIDRLERIRMDSGTLSLNQVDQDFIRAFRDYGLDVDGSPAEASIQSLRTRPGLAIPLAASLDHWVSAREPKSDGWKRLVAVVYGIDPDPLRHRLRLTWGQPITAKERAELISLAHSINVRAQHPEALVCLARVLTRAKEPDAAVRILREARSIFPGDFWLNHELGATLYDQHDHEGAIRFNTAAISIRPNSASAHCNLGVALRSRKMLDEAIACFRKAVELEQKRVEFHIQLGYALGLRGAPDDGMASYDEALRLQPSNCYANHAFGCYLRDITHDYKRAITHFRKAIELGPDYVQVSQVYGDFCRLLVLYGAQDELTATIETLRRSPTTHRDTLAQCLNVTAWVLATHTEPARRDPDHAVSLSREAVELMPQNAAYRDTLGIALYRTGEWKAAINTLVQANHSAGNDHLGYNSLFIAMSYWQIGNKGEARRWYEKGMEWIDKKQSKNEEIRRFRAEAEELLQLNSK